MEPEGSLPCSQEPSTGPYTEPDQSNPYHTIRSLLRSISLLSTHLRLGLPTGLFPSGFLTNILYAFLFVPLVLHVLAISSSFTWLFELYLEKSTSYEAPHYAVVHRRKKVQRNVRSTQCNTYRPTSNFKLKKSKILSLSTLHNCEQSAIIRISGVRLYREIKKIISLKISSAKNWRWSFSFERLDLQ
jgi:hypothetical protein